LPSLQEAAEAHLAVPEEARRSEAPIATRLSASEIPHRLGRSANVRPIRKASSAPSIAGTNFSTAHAIALGVLSTVASHPRFMNLGDLKNHKALMRAIRDGASIEFLPFVTPDLAIPIEAFQRSQHREYVTQVRRDKNQELAVTRAREAAQWIAERRVPNIVHFCDRFDVYERRRHRRTIHTLEQVWIAKSTTCDDALRLIAIEPIFDREDVSPDAVARHKELAALGYEVQLAIGWWALIDPVRFVVANLLEAGLSVPDQMRILRPGCRIMDYVCTSCRKPMIRDQSGNGIVELKGWPVHEGDCFNRVIDTGESDGWSERL
jgi:hypothetical protein